MCVCFLFVVHDIRCNRRFYMLYGKLYWRVHCFVCHCIFFPFYVWGLLQFVICVCQCASRFSRPFLPTAYQTFLKIISCLVCNGRWRDARLMGWVLESRDLDEGWLLLVGDLSSTDHGIKQRRGGSQGVNRTISGLLHSSLDGVAPVHAAEA